MKIKKGMTSNGYAKILFIEKITLALTHKFYEEVNTKNDITDSWKMVKSEVSRLAFNY